MGGEGVPVSDRELLQMAAKAAGMTLGAWREAFGAFMYRDVAPGRGYWNPLTDDGDALRLAVRLRLLISLHERFEVHVVWWRNGERGEIRETDKDSYVATRRAIVRAAAEIGRQHD